jgi:hypothetical protein
MEPDDHPPLVEIRVDIHDPPGFGWVGKTVAVVMVLGAFLFVVGTILSGIAAAGVLFSGH